MTYLTGSLKMASVSEELLCAPPSVNSFFMWVIEDDLQGRRDALTLL